MYKVSHIEPFWDDEYKHLDYTREAFNDPISEKYWREIGYNHEHFVGKMADFCKPQPSWNNKIIQEFDWNDIGTSYYLMETGVILPTHSDLYRRYKKIHNLTEYNTIWRALIFLEDRRWGHIIEIDEQVLNWKAGDMIIWKNDEKHLAANIGIEPRYTLQVTGWSNE